jgi:hypothetical protein
MDYRLEQAAITENVGKQKCSKFDFLTAIILFQSSTCSHHLQCTIEKRGRKECKGRPQSSSSGGSYRPLIAFHFI